MDIVNGIIEGVSCVILVGGESKRIGSDKARVELKGKKLFTHVFEKVSPLFDDIMISARGFDYPIGELGKTEKARLISDNNDDSEIRGPALGLSSALTEARNQWVFMVACDHPLIVPELIRHLAGMRKGFDCVVPVTDHKTQSLFALYNKNCLATLRQRIENTGANKGRSLYGFLKETKTLKVRYVTEEEIKTIDPTLESFIDIDTMEELAKLEKTTTNN